MLSLLGFLTIFAFLALIMTKRLSGHVALIVFPALAAVIGAAVTGTYAYSAIGKMMLDGLVRVAPVGIMIAFAILFFGLMLDVGLFDPLIKGLVRLLKGDPVKVAVGAFALTVLVALDGDGATTFMITCSAMVPIFKPDGFRLWNRAGHHRACRGFGADDDRIPLSPLTASTFILIGLRGVELGEHQKFVFGWAFSVTIVMTIACLTIGVLPFPRF